MADAYFLNDNDRRTLKELIREFENRRQNQSSQSGDEKPPQAPEVYVARVPAGGIPALDEGYTGTGTGTGSIAPDMPGSAVCAVYRLVVDSAGTPYLIRVADLNKVVYNLSSSIVTGNGWILVSRDKFGYWYAGGAIDLSDDVAEASETIVDHVHVVESIPDTGTGTAAGPTWYCERVAMPAGGGWPPVADPTTVYLNVRESENRYPRLMDASGTATHIIPLYQDREGNHYIVFWKTETEASFEAPTSFTITQDPATCTITATPVLGTYTVYLEVAPVTDPRTGLRLRIT